MNDEEKAALHNALMKLQNNGYNPSTGKGNESKWQNPLSSDAIKGYAENLGVSGAGASQFPGINALFSPSNAKNQGGGFSERQGGFPSPTTGQPSLNRQGGPLDVSPSGVVGEVASNYLDPRMHLKGIGATVGNAKALMTPEEYMAKEASNPDVKAVLADTRKYSTDTVNPLKAQGIENAMESMGQDRANNQAKASAKYMDDATAPMEDPGTQFPKINSLWTNNGTPMGSNSTTAGQALADSNTLTGQIPQSQFGNVLQQASPILPPNYGKIIRKP